MPAVEPLHEVELQRDALDHHAIVSISADVKKFRENLTDHENAIGVFKGKYLAVLYALSEPGEAVVGVDLFIGATNNDPRPVIEEVKANVAAACGESARLNILAADSCATWAKEPDSSHRQAVSVSRVQQLV